MSTLSSGGTGDDNPPVANNVWNNNTSFIYKGYINIPNVNTIPGNSNGDISFLKLIDDSAAIYIDGHQVFNDGTWNNYTVVQLNQAANSWLSPGQHSFYLVMNNGGGGAGPNGQYGSAIGFGWDLTGSMPSQTLQSTKGTVASQFNNTIGGVNANNTNGTFKMPLDPGNGSVFTVGPGSTTFSSALVVTADSSIQLPAAATPFTFPSLTENGFKLSITGDAARRPFWAPRPSPAARPWTCRAAICSPWRAP